MARRTNGDNAMSAAFIAHCRASRKALGLTQDAFAQALAKEGFEFTRQALANQEGGRVTFVTIEQLVAASKVFGVPMESLLLPWSCPVCNDTPAPQTRCLACGAENRGA